MAQLFTAAVRWIEAESATVANRDADRDAYSRQNHAAR